MQHKRLGFDKEHVLVVHGARSLGRQVAAFRERLGVLAQVAAASVTQSLPGHPFDSTLFIPEQPANYEQTSLTYVMVDEHYTEALGLRIVQGRNFAPGDFASDSTAFLINQSVASVLGWEEPVGKRMKLAGREGRVIGVVEDFHYGSLRHRIQPLVLPFLRWDRSYVAVRLQPGNVADAVSAVRQVWGEVRAPSALRVFLSGGELPAALRERAAHGPGVRSFFGARHFHCLPGAVRLASFMVQQRTKEIGIRKVLGATVEHIVLLLSRDFARLVLIAFLVASPVAYYILDRCCRILPIASTSVGGYLQRPEGWPCLWRC